MPHLSRSLLSLLIVGGLIALMGVLTWAAWGGHFPLIKTSGEVANRERDLLFFAVALSLLVLVPVYFMLFLFAWRYRDGHRKQYKPDWDNNKKFEMLWWGIPIAIIAVLAVVTWVTSHSLDPYKPLASQYPPVKIQVIALEWKWLFIYPEQNVASVNEVAFPVDRPVEFTITSDGPMNSFWMPELAGQIYAMSGMSTKLHVAADHVGDYKGLSSNISGPGFADMKFTAKALSVERYAAWLGEARLRSNSLNQETYAHLRKRSVDNDVMYYSGLENGLYDTIVQGYSGKVDRPNEVKSTEGSSPSQVKMKNSGRDQMGNNNHEMEHMQ